MKLLLYGINYSPELTGVGKYSGEMGTWLSDKGHQIRVVTAQPYYPHWKAMWGYNNRRYSESREHGVLVRRCPLYIPRKLTFFKRAVHLCSFALSSFFPLLGQIIWKPNLVILIVPTLFCALNALLVSRLSGAKCIIHIQDFEVDAMFGLSVAGTDSNWFKTSIYYLEKWLLNRFDLVSTISPNMCINAISKGVSKDSVLLFPNWSEVSRFSNIARDYTYLYSLGVPKDKKTVLYAGNIGEKQGFETLIEAARQFENQDNIHFLIVGDGAGKQKLVAKAKATNLSNVSFADLQPYEFLPKLLALADCHLVIQHRGAADAVLPSKLTNILAVGGNAVITADSKTSLGVLCNDFAGIAVLVEPESTASLVIGIREALSMPRVNITAQNYAKVYLDKDQILQKFENDLKHLCEGEEGEVDDR